MVASSSARRITFPPISIPLTCLQVIAARPGGGNGRYYPNLRASVTASTAISLPDASRIGDRRHVRWYKVMPPHRRNIVDVLIGKSIRQLNPWRVIMAGRAEH